jgi:hypothetical protein
LELAAGEHGAIPRRTKILGRPHGPATRDPVEASAARTLRSQVASSGTRPSADHGPRTARPWQGRAQYDPSRGPVTQTGPGADTITNQDERPHGHPAGQVARPARTNRSQAPAGTRAARTPLRPSDSDRATARERTNPPAGTNGPRPSCPIRPSAHLRPATAGPRRAPALHSLSRGPVTRKEPHWPGVNHVAGPHLASPHVPDQLGQVPHPGIAVFDSVHRPRSSADPRPATARPGRTRAARTLPRAGDPD